MGGEDSTDMNPGYADEIVSVPLSDNIADG